MLTKNTWPNLKLTEINLLKLKSQRGRMYVPCNVRTTYCNWHKPCRATTATGTNISSRSWYWRTAETGRRICSRRSQRRPSPGPLFFPCDRQPTRVPKKIRCAPFRIPRRASVWQKRILCNIRFTFFFFFFLIWSVQYIFLAISNKIINNITEHIK